MATIAAGTYTDPSDGLEVIYNEGDPIGERTHRNTKDESAKPAGLPPGLDGPRSKPGDGHGASIYYVNGPLGAGSDAVAKHNNMPPSMPVYRVVKIV